MLLDPIGAGVQAILGAIRIHKTNEWCKLQVAMVWSYIWAFNVNAGTMLTIGKPLAFAIGQGMLLGASASYLVWLNSPLTRHSAAMVPVELSNENLELKQVNK